MKTPSALNARMQELLYQALETELGGIQIYQTALQCAINDDLIDEWSGYLEQTLQHRDILLMVFNVLGLDPQTQTPGRRVVSHIGRSLVSAMQQALHGDDRAAAEVVAGECVCLAETKDHLNWELIGEVAGHVGGDAGKVLQAAFDKVEDQEDEHLYHTKGWTRELWMQSLGLPAVLPPPEEVRDVSAAIEAAQAENAREEMV